MKKIINIYIALAALLALIACTKEKPNQQQNIKTAVKQINPDKNAQSANEFWVKFRKAALEDDKKTLSSMTGFPFPIIIGPGDFMVKNVKQDEVSFEFHGKESFSLLFDVLLNLKDQEMHKIIKQTETIPYKDIQDKLFRIGSFYFVFTDDKWTFAWVALNNYPDIFATGMKGTPQQDLDEFYSKFRQAVISNDKKAIVSMTAFQFSVNSEDKSTGELAFMEKYDEKSFLKILDTLLNMDAGTSKKPESMRSFIKRNETIEPNNTCSEFDNHCDTGKFLFSRRLGKWYFASVTKNHYDE